MIGTLGMRKISLFLFLVGLLFLLNGNLVQGWSNGGYSVDPSRPDYGTHDWIAQHALDYLPTEEKQYILDNFEAYLYGTELPDNNRATDKIGDTTKHHIYFWGSGTLQDDSAALRAAQEFQKALSFLKANDYANASKAAGIMSHYIVDVAAFGHVMGVATNWGSEVHHSDYELYVNSKTLVYNSSFSSYLNFDGSLSIISPYDAAKGLAYDTTFDGNSNLTCVWMNENYNWSNPVFLSRAGDSLNLAANVLADTLHTLFWASNTAIIPEFPSVQMVVVLIIFTLSGILLLRRGSLKRVKKAFVEFDLTIVVIK
jgi:hypothetical protein